MLRAFGLAIILVVGAVILSFANDKPIAQFSYSGGGAPYTVLFDASGSSDPDGSITSYQWTFGDGYTGSGESVHHTYSGAGSFQVTLVVFDDAHAAAIATETVVITPSGALQETPGDSNPARADVPVGLKIGQAAPDFTLKDFAGNEVSLSDFLGKVVILEFWRSTCPHCRDFMPHLKDILDRYKDDGLVVVLVALDGNMAAAQGYLDLNGYTDFINLWDDPAKGEDRIADLYEVWTVPHTLLIDRHGVIRYTGYPTRLLDLDIVPLL